MKRSVAGLALAAMSVCTPGMAAECFAPASAQAATSINVVAPEMVRVPSPDLACLSAEAFLARVRTPVGLPAAYVPLTKDDNTPWRFDMRQNGKQMTAVEFDAWMLAKGIRVAKGKPVEATVADPAALLPLPVETGQ